MLLVAGGIGITPIRALIEEMEGDIIVLYRVVSEDDLVFRDELEQLAAERGITVHYVVGDHTTPKGASCSHRPTCGNSCPMWPNARSTYVVRLAFIDVLENELRRAGVPRRHLHIERFAL